ncbi:MAG: alkaline phosphatase family protein [Acidimicrobiia bacterium]|nr:alkaline phosphatase family protein [Acidimicrobiia bacterium]
MRSGRGVAAGVGALAWAAALIGCSSGGSSSTAPTTTRGSPTPIKHLVVIYQENVSFDHYFGTYPNAANPAGEPSFNARQGTPSVHGLDQALLTQNANSVNPARLGRSQALTCDQDHGYTDEQKAFDNGRMDKFVQSIGTATGKSPTGQPCQASQVMSYYDGNTTTALWNYAQRFAMSDNSFGTTFGPSAPGALNLISGQTSGIVATATPGTSSLNGEVQGNTVIGDPQPLGDDCSSRDQVQLAGRNIGDLLNAKAVTWGFFTAGFAPTTPYNPPTTPKAVCGASHPIGAGIGGAGQWGTKGDYIPHHEPFQFFASTANPHHLPPSTAAMIGHSDQANHQYDLTDFWTAVNSGGMPAVSFLKAAGYQDGHAGYSDPLDEQQFLVDTINKLEARPEWASTAVVISYDDSDGWYDHVASPTVNGSTTPADALEGPGQCGPGPKLGTAQARCGYGPRLPLLVISSWAKANFVDHSVTDQSSILRFIEDNWHTGRIGGGSYDAVAGSLDGMLNLGGGPGTFKLVLDPTTGQPMS